jgi:hypothetical protein
VSTVSWLAWLLLRFFFPLNSTLNTSFLLSFTSSSSSSSSYTIYLGPEKGWPESVCELEMLLLYGREAGF